MNHPYIWCHGVSETLGLNYENHTTNDEQTQEDLFTEDNRTSQIIGGAKINGEDFSFATVTLAPRNILDRKRANTGDIEPTIVTMATDA